MNNSDIIITGVAGFIGSNLAIRLVKEGYSVVGIDNLSYGNERNIRDIKNNKNFKFLTGDLMNPLILSGFHGNIIIHLASQKIPRYSNALRTLEENYTILNNVVQKCIRDGSKIIFASTSDVYGKNIKIPFSENSDLVMGPTTIKRWSYAISKIYGEQYIISNHDEYDLKYTITRFFGSYGPNQNLTWWGGPQSVFINSAFRNEEIEIHGNGEQTRTFTFINDTIDALMHCISNPKAENEIFNIGSYNTETSIIDLAKLIWSLINGKDSKPKLKFLPYSSFGRYEDVMRRVPDVSKLTEFFGFKSQYSLIDGLLKTIEWQKQFI